MNPLYTSAVPMSGTAVVFGRAGPFLVEFAVLAEDMPGVPPAPRASTRLAGNGAEPG